MRIRREAVYLQLSHEEAALLRQALSCDGHPNSRTMWELLMDHKAWLLKNGRDIRGVECSEHQT